MWFTFHSCLSDFLFLLSEAWYGMKRLTRMESESLERVCVRGLLIRNFTLSSIKVGRAIMTDRFTPTSLRRALNIVDKLTSNCCRTLIVCAAGWLISNFHLPPSRKNNFEFTPTAFFTWRNSSARRSDLLMWTNILYWFGARREGENRKRKHFPVNL